MEDFKQQAKEYVKQIYIQHREDDIDAWNSLIDVIFDFTIIIITDHLKDYHQHK